MIQTLAVVGTGYVGLPLALLAEQKGYNVIGVDTDSDKITLLNRKVLPFLDDGLGEKLRVSNVGFTTDFRMVSNADIVTICVPTPLDENRKPDLRFVKSAAEQVSANLKSGALVCLESTVYPGVSEEIVLPALRDSQKNFYLAYCPERIDPGNAVYHVGNIPRVVGALNPESLDKAVQFYSSIINAKIIQISSLMAAEASKVIENAQRDTLIAWANEIAMSIVRWGLDASEVLDAAGTKPFGFVKVNPGRGVGGHCISVDPEYLIKRALERNGFEHHLLMAARKINNGMPEYTAELVQDGLNQINLPVKNTEIAVLGLAYKPEVSDVRESPVLEIIKILKRKGGRIRTFDPHVPKMSNKETLEDAINGASAVLVGTAHKQLVEQVTPKLLTSHKVKVFVDGENKFDKKGIKAEGIVYLGVGRR